MFATIKQTNSAILNPVFSKCDKRLNSILKNQTEKLIKNVPNRQTASQETQTSNLSKRRELKLLDVRQRARQIK